VKGKLALAAATGAAAFAYLRGVRPWHLRWGAIDEDVARRMPLDEVIERPTYVTNRAITIRARAAQVWPWLAQMGESPRAGFYSYAWVERLMGMSIENAGRLLPEYQTLHEGQQIDNKGTMVVRGVEPGRWVVLGPPREQAFGDCTWCLALYPSGPDETRLVSRVRARINKTPAGLFWLTLLDPGQFIMERKMLLLIKQHAERLAGQAAGAPAGDAVPAHAIR
jgi:hypothetical protein